MQRALIVIDVQNEYFAGMLPITHPQGHLSKILQAMVGAGLISNVTRGRYRKVPVEDRMGEHDLDESGE